VALICYFNAYIAAGQACALTKRLLTDKKNCPDGSKPIHHLMQNPSFYGSIRITQLKEEKIKKLPLHTYSFLK